jgi:sugar lactone lactonase YvrE
VALSQGFKQEYLVQHLAKRWLKSMRQLWSQPRRRLSRRTPPATRLLFEGLESRLVPATITTIAGSGHVGYAGDGGPATSALLDLPFGTAVDSSGNVFLADTYNNVIREVVHATGNIITVAGTGAATYNGDGGPATLSNIGRPFGVAVDGSGNLFIADTYNNRIREVVKSTGTMITIAGTGATGFGGDGGPATSAMLNAPDAVAVDGGGNVFFSDQGNNRIREVLHWNGSIVTVAGTGAAGYNGDFGPATSAMLNQPNGVAVDVNGNIFISDWHNNRIREVLNATGNILTVAGTGTAGYSGDGGQSNSAMVNSPGGVAVDGSGNLFIADTYNNRIRKVTIANHVITTVAGTGTSGFGGDGGPATSALLYMPYGVTVDGSGSIYIADTYNQRIRQVLGTMGLGGLSNTAWTVNQPGYSGSVSITGGTAPYSNLVTSGLPMGLTATLSGSTITISGTPTYVFTYSSVTLSVQDAVGNVGSRTYTIAINPPLYLAPLTVTQWTAQVEGYTGSIAISGGTGPFTLMAQANMPPGLTPVLSGSTIYLQGIPSTPGTYSNIQLAVGDVTGAYFYGTFSMTITAPAPGSILTVAGIDYAGYSGDGGPANQARLYNPESVAVDSSGNVFIADFYNSRIREIVKATGNIITVAGTGTNGFSGDGGPATSAQVYYPTGVAVDSSGNVFIADRYNYRVREIVKATGIIITVAGNGSSTDSGDGGPATSAGIAEPLSLAVDANGNIFIADAIACRIREVVKATGTIITVAGTGMPGSSGDNGPATAATMNNPNDVAVDSSGNLYITDSGNNRVREVVQATGNIVNIAGTGTYGYSGDNGPATSAQLYYPIGVAVDAYGDVFIADTYNSRVRVIVQGSGTIITYAGSSTSGYGGDGGPATSGKLSYPYGVSLDAGGDLFIADMNNNVVREVLPIPAPVMGPLSPLQWTVNQGGYFGNIPITGAAPPYGAFVTASGMPPGLTVSSNVTSSGNNNSIVITGTPTAVGTYTATVTIRGVSGAPLASRTYTITINAFPAPATLSQSQWTVGRSGYAGTIPISGGTGTLSLAAESNLPPGLSATLVGSQITITGTPTTVGTYGNIQFTVLDAVGATSTVTYSITINATPTLGALSTPAWTVNQSGSGTVSVLGGTAPLGNLTATGLPPGVTAALSGGTITLSGTPIYTGMYTTHLSVQDTAGATASGLYYITVAGPAASLAVIPNPTALTAGTSASFTLTALDIYGFQAPSYRGTVSFNSSDPAAVLPASYTFTAADAGTHTFNFTLKTAGSEQLYASDPAGLYGISMPITVSPAALDHFAVAAPQYSASYYGFNVTVAAKDAYNNTIPNYAGTVHFTSSDSAATLPADYTYTPADLGSHAFSATLQTPGTQTIAVNDNANVAVSGTASVQDFDYVPGLHFVLTPSVTTATAGAAFDLTLTALDENNNVAAHYDGTVSFWTTDRGSGVVLPADYTFTAADAGVHTFAGGVTLVTAGSQSISVVDTSSLVSGGYGLSSVSITVNPADTSTFTITGLPLTVTRGAAQTFTVSSKDPYGNLTPGYSGTVHFSSSDPQAVLPPDMTLNGGAGTFQVVFGNLGTQSLTVADTSNSALTATQGGITVIPAPAVGIVVTGFPSSTTAGATGTFSVTAFDTYGYVASGYSGTVHFTSTDPLAVLPANVTLTNGTGSFSATLETAGSQSLTATDTVNASLSGTEGGIAVAPAAAATLTLTGFPASITAGVAGTATLTARDAYGNTATGYTGTVHFTSSDAAAQLPADYTFTAADAGVHTFSATLVTAGSQNLGVQDAQDNLTGGPDAVSVAPAAASNLVVTAYSASTTAGATDSVTIAAQDPYGNLATGYTGTVHFSSSDSQAGLPADYTFTATDAGVHTFAVVLKTAGSQTVSFQDVQAGWGSALSISVTAATASQLVLSGFPSATTAGFANSFTVHAYDPYGNTATGYTGTVHFTSSDAAALLPASYSFTAADAGVHTFSASLLTAGSQSLGVQDASNNLSGTQSAISVAPAAASKLVVTAYSASTTAGGIDNVTVTAQDAYGNVATGYGGTVRVSSSDAQATLPADYSFTTTDAGVHTFAVALKTAGSQTVSFQDGSNGLSATAGISVAAAAASEFALSGFPTQTTAGAAHSLTITALDAYGNVATGYTGTVHVSSSDLQAALPADHSFTAADAGVHTFSVSLCTAGTQSLTATDTATPTLSTSQAGISVVAGAVSGLTVSGYPATTAGASHSFTVTARDAYGNLVTGYADTVHFTSSDPRAILPADVALTSGTGSFSATFDTAGAQSLTATDTVNASFSGTEGSISVSPAAAATLTLAGFPTSVTAGAAGTATVTALDAYGNVATGYTGTVHFSSSDAQAVLPADYTFTIADAGSHTFTITFKTAATQSLTVADTTGTLANGSQSGIVVNAAAVARLTGSAPASSIPNAGYPFSVEALDAYGNLVRSYAGTVHFASSDPQAVLPADYTYTGADAGSHNFAATFKTVGTQTITVTDTGTAGVGVYQFSVNVQVGQAAGLTLTGFPAQTTAGVARTFTVRAYDLYGNTATGYTGTVHFTSSDAAAQLPADYTFTAADAGVHTFSATLITAGSQGLWVHDASNNFTADQTAISVAAAAASKLVVTAYSASTTAGAGDSVTIAAKDPYGNFATGYTGTVHVTSSDSQAGLPADYTFTAADGGAHTFAVVLKTAGSQTVTFQDAQHGFTTTASVSVVAAAASQFVLSGFPSATTAGAAQSLKLTALDAYGNIATGYTGTVHFTSSDAQAVLPADYSFTTADAGAHTFSASLCTAGNQSLTATDTATSTLTASETGISVVAGALSKFIVGGYPATTAGTSHSFAVTATDAYGNVITGYRGAVHFTSSDLQAGLPGNYTFSANDNGVHTFSATLKTAGSQSLTVTDTGTSNITGRQTGIQVAAAAATHLSITLPASASIGVAVTATVTALDAYGNIATGYLGTIRFTSNDSKAILPSNYTFVAADAGVHSFTVTFKSTGTQTLTATDTHTGSIKGNASVKVS